MPINNSFVDSMFDDEYGRVFSLLLSPGKYDFWLDSTHPWLQYDSPLFTKPITLKPKEIKYVGEFYANGCLNISLTIRDNSLRDINKIKSLEPNLNEEKVNIDIVELLDR
ncbi:MAG: hypothetical protein GTO02_11020 [Candidatus Dadabacteria bacterium]|nr:hypothetical protein [Candidatus Dadabacteria bacterium]